jgi:uncharacterized protein YbjT (DUF2867 family)
MPETVFIAGATGFMGRRLAAELLRRGHRVRGLARPGSETRLPAGCEAVVADATRPETYADAVRGAGTFVQLVGVSHPNPAKRDQFRRIDGASAAGALDVARAAGVRNFVYVSVAQPAPVMKSYVAVRAAAEDALRASGLPSTVLRPWYVLGPGRRWPALILPVYWLLELFPPTRSAARRFGLLTAEEMTRALVAAAENPPPSGMRIWDVPAIRKGGVG